LFGAEKGSRLDADSQLTPEIEAVLRLFGADGRADIEIVVLVGNVVRAAAEQCAPIRVWFKRALVLLASKLRPRAKLDAEIKVFASLH